MIFKTYSQIKEKVQRDLDLQEETFITDDELLDYCNEAIDEAEAEIHTIYEDYFLTKANIALVAAQQAYDLPSDIYADKIRAIIYSNGSDIYAVKRLRYSNRFEEIAIDLAYSNTDEYRYLITNSTADGLKLNLFPTPQETSATAVTIWYLRNATRMVADATECDIPEFVNFVIWYMKVRCYEKEGHSNLQYAVGELERQRKIMIDTLSNRQPDDDTEVEKDFSLYEEIS